MTDPVDISPQHEDPQLTQPADNESTPPAKSSRPAWPLPLTTGVAGFILGVAVVGGAIGIGSAMSTRSHNASVQKAAASSKAILSKAVHGCDMVDGPSTDLADGGYTLTVDSKGKEDLTGISYSDLTCLEKVLKTPESVAAHIGQTTSLDGRQTESWGKVTMSWSFHPDRGLDAVYTVDR